MTVHETPEDRLAAWRTEALQTTNRIVALLGTPLVIWTGVSLWSENRPIAVVAFVTAAILLLPLALPARFETLRRAALVIGLVSVCFNMVLNGASARTGLVVWATAIIATLAIGRGTALVIIVCASGLLVASGRLMTSEWLLPFEASDPVILGRTVLTFAILTTAVVSVVRGVIALLERNLAAATDLVAALRREGTARAAIDWRLAQSDEDSRLGIARQLQRELRTSLTSLRKSLTQVFDNGTGSDDAVVGDAAARIGHLIEYVRSASRQLRPVLLDDAGLAPALQALAQSELGRNAILHEVDLQIDRRLPPAVEVACYRIVQEAVDNVVRHAYATRVRIAALSRPGELELVVDDNGAGFDVEQVMSQDVPAVGLSGMRRRSDSLGGTLHVDSTPGRGTHVRFTLPLVNTT